jgi:5-methylcytosine-specific restriction endonuclease McrA
MMGKKQIREKFHKGVFERDHYKCVICKKKAVDAHHIIDRSLFPDGGYILDNGVSLCSGHHIEAEKNKIFPSQLRQKAGIMIRILPPGFDQTKEYDKWGQEIERIKNV